MSKNNVVELSGRDTIADPLTELLRSGAERLTYQAVEAELQTSIVAMRVKITKVRARTGEAVTFRSALVPPYVSKTKTLEAALP